MRILPAVMVFAALSLAGCGGGGGGTPDPDPEPEAPGYADFIAAAWTAFAGGDYAGAIAEFASAKAADAAQAEPFAGTGWCHARLGDPAAAAGKFEAAAGLAASTSVAADLQAGWAFALNALKDPAGADLSNFVESNARADAALALQPDWVFDPLAEYDAADLHVVRAENHFALGEFEASLAAVQALDPAFDADVNTGDGQLALAAKIEELKEAEA